MTGRLFERLEPPPGGLSRLRARIREPRRVAPRRVLVPALAAALAVMVAGSWLLGKRQVDLLGDLRDRPSGLALGLGALPDEPVALLPGERTSAALERVPTGEPRVIFYRVSSTAWRW